MILASIILFAVSWITFGSIPGYLTAFLLAGAVITALEAVNRRREAGWGE